VTDSRGNALPKRESVPFIANSLGILQFPADIRDSPGTGDHVMGAAVAAWLAQFPRQRWGREWVESGEMTMRFRRHLTSGDSLTIELMHADGAMTMAVRGDDGMLSCDASASRRVVQPFSSVDRFERRPRPDPLTKPVPEHLDDLMLGSEQFTFDADRDLEFTALLGDDWWREHRVAHPTWLISAANGLLRNNLDFADGRWVHAGATVQNIGVIESGSVIDLYGRFARLFVAGGRDFAEVDFLFAVDGAPKTMMRFVIVYR
jgi:hypothetical protein